MSKGPSTFRQRDMAAAIRAVRAAGCVVSRVIVDRQGRIVVDLDKGDAVQQKNEWDEYFDQPKA